MKQNPTIPAVIKYACGALRNITVNPENQVIAGAAGVVKVHASVFSYPTKKLKKKTSLTLAASCLFHLVLHPFLPMVLHTMVNHPLHIVLLSLWYPPL